MTGAAFKTGKTVVCNKIQQLKNFLPSIDNLTPNVKDVHSLMIVPIFGHRAQMIQNSDGSIHEAYVDPRKPDNRKPIAILQFINKTDFKQIDDYDLVSLEN